MWLIFFFFFCTLYNNLEMFLSVARTGLLSKDQREITLGLIHRRDSWIENSFSSFHYTFFFKLKYISSLWPSLMAFTACRFMVDSEDWPWKKQSWCRTMLTFLLGDYFVSLDWKISFVLMLLWKKKWKKFTWSCIFTCACRQVPPWELGRFTIPSLCAAVQISNHSLISIHA